MKKKIADIALVVSIVLIVVVAVYGVSHREKEQETVGGGYYAESDEDIYYLDEHELAEFSDVIVEEFHKESELTVSLVDTSVTVDLKQTGVLDFDVFNKTQKVTYHGSGRFYVDLSMLGKHSVSLDNDRAVVTIEIPRTKIAEIEINPDKFTCEETEKGFLAFGDLKFTAKEYNDLETECKHRIEAAVDTAANRKTADERAIEEMTKIYEPIVKAVDDAYRVEIVFME